ncbi:MAG TPA: hypothetical protein VII58_12395 [Acidobacteriaceae bacterium]
MSDPAINEGLTNEDPTPIGTGDTDPGEKKEERPMIDVHAPHGGLHTWKDFWIHLGTITLGLLIAISLEQSVEWLHRVQQRHQLEEDLRTEGENNRRHAEIDIALYDKIVVWLVQLQHGVDEARASGGKIAFVYPARPEGIPDSPRYVAYHVLQTEIWTTAKESSLLVLLPRDEAQLYARLYIQADQVQTTRDRTRETGMQQGAFETRFSHGSYPPDLDLSKLTLQQLDEYEKVLADELESVRVATVRLKIFDTANSYLLSGGGSEDELRKAILKANMPQ